MCTSGFWKNKNGDIVFFKNRDNKYNHINERYEHINGGLYIRDDNDKFEGMNQYGVFIVENTLVPTETEDKENINDFIKQILPVAKTPKEALNFFVYEHKIHTFAAGLIIGNAEKVFFVEVVPNRLAYADISEAPYFFITNHGQLLWNQGEPPEINPTRARYALVRKLIEKVENTEDIKKMLAYHDGEASVCRHANVGKSHTQSSFLFYPNERKAEIMIGGYPCEKEYETLYLK
jgi:hypothetical protein